ncbi:MAG: hypothetical protein JSU06_16385 [Actinobacteria bacterium]|nr:hypothetical protein [Actinomycetota bacterium]
MAAGGGRRGWIDRLALRAAGVSPARQEARAGAPTAGSEDGLTRSRLLKSAAVAGVAALLPWQAGTGSARAEADCLDPCLGLMDAGRNRALRKCERIRPGEFILGGWSAGVFCALRTVDFWTASREECFKANCGKYGNAIRHGGNIGGLPVAPLEVPPGQVSGCEICTRAGGYCGVCPTGSGGMPATQGFFCGTPGVLPCVYCNGC